MFSKSIRFFLRVLRFAKRHLLTVFEFLYFQLYRRNRKQSWNAHLGREYQGSRALDLMENIFPVFPAGHDWSAAAGAQLRDPEGTCKILEEADNASAHRMDLLGSGLISVDKPEGGGIDWHRDHKSGESWSATRFFKYTQTVKREGADIKWVRELSRGEHLIRLGQAYQLGRSGAVGGKHKPEAYAEECVSQILSWIEANPHPWGSNWQCTMDVGLRAINWVLALDLIYASGVITPCRAETIIGALVEHGRHIFRNPEDNPGGITTNHYIADLVAQVVLGVCLPFCREAETWNREGMRLLEIEVGKQILPDSGVCFEASTGYHRLDLEMLLWVGLCFEAKNRDMPGWLERTIAAMYGALASMLKSSGEVPAFGDQDNGRALNLFPRRHLDQKYLRALFSEGEESPEQIWSLGTGRWEKLEQVPSPRKFFSYPDVGWHGVRYSGFDLSIVCGPVGTAGWGGHSHNDQLSVELSVNGVNFLGDPGTYVYTADPSQRNLFRSTAMHSTVSVEGLEQCRFKDLFGREADGRGDVNCFQQTEGGRFVFDGEFKGAYRHHRSLELDAVNGSLIGEDRVDCPKGHGFVAWNMVLHPGVTVRLKGEKGLVMEADGIECVLEVSEGAEQGFLIETIGYSEEYGKKRESRKIVCPMANDQTFRWAFKRVKNEKQGT